jgi:hypothetical protein
MSIRERLSSVLSLLRGGAAFRVVINGLSDEFEAFASDTESVKDSLFIDTAEGQSLDLISEQFGAIGRRRGRDDDDFRQFLQGLVPAFDGRGTVSDVRLAVSSGVTFDRELVTLREDFGNREYQVELLESGWRAHRTGTTRDLADLADPVAVDRVDPVYLFSAPSVVRLQANATESGIETVSEDVSVALNGADAQSELFAIGLSSDDLGALSTQGFELSTETI